MPLTEKDNKKKLLLEALRDAEIISDSFNGRITIDIHQGGVRGLEKQERVWGDLPIKTGK